MADTVERAEVLVGGDGSAPDVATAALDAGEKVIGQVLRAGALGSGALFLLSVVLEGLSPTWLTEGHLGGLRAVAASLLVAAPVVRQVVAGLTFAGHREWRYAFAAAVVLLLLALGMGLGWTH